MTLTTFTVQPQSETPSAQEQMEEQTWKNICSKLLSGEDAQPGCSECSNGYKQIPSKSGYGWDLTPCSCMAAYRTYQHAKEMFDEEYSNINIRTLRKYPIQEYNFNQYTFRFLEAAIDGKLKEGKRWLYAFGGPGTGKTYFAMMALMLGVTKGYSSLYVNVPKLMDDLRPSEKDEGRLWRDRCIEADVLILDDIGQERYSERVLERLYIIINERYLNDQFTVFTSNFDIDRLGEKMRHPAIISRIKHLSVPKCFGVQDLRLQSS